MTAMRSVSFLRSSSAPLTDRRAARRRGRDEQDRKLVDRERHELRRHVDAAQRRSCSDLDIGDGLGADAALVAQLDLGAHLAQDRQQAGARRVDADVLDQQAVARARGSRRR